MAQEKKVRNQYGWIETSQPIAVIPTTDDNNHKYILFLHIDHLYWFYFLLCTYLSTIVTSTSTMSEVEERTKNSKPEKNKNQTTKIAITQQTINNVEISF